MKDPQLKILLDLNKKYNLSILLKILDTIKFNNSVYQKHLEREEDRKGGKKLKKSKFDIDKPVMSICTMHKSKGLEWDEVQLVYQKPLNLEELKHIYKVSDDDYKKIDDLIHSIEEEKKLIYVAMTRAKKRLKFDSSIARKYFL
jgi:superfamily I DNA/RNA helicase